MAAASQYTELLQIMLYDLLCARKQGFLTPRQHGAAKDALIGKDDLPKAVVDGLLRLKVHRDLQGDQAVAGLRSQAEAHGLWCAPSDDPAVRRETAELAREAADAEESRVHRAAHVAQAAAAAPPRPPAPKRAAQPPPIARVTGGLRRQISSPVASAQAELAAKERLKRAPEPPIYARSSATVPVVDCSSCGTLFFSDR